MSSTLILSLATGGIAQERRVPIQPLRVLDFDGSLFFEGHYRQETEQNNQVTTEETDLLLEEGVELIGRGYIYHPNLIDWNVNLRLGLSQQRIGVDDEEFDSDGTLLGYDISSLILREKPISGRLFFSQTQDFVSRSFARHIEIDNARQGFAVNTRGEFPMELLVEHLSIHEDSGIRIIEEDTWLARYTVIDQRDPDYFTRLRYEHQETDETNTFLATGDEDPIVRDLPTRRDELTISNFWQFGDEPLKHRLSGNIRALNRTGFFENRVFSIDQRLDLIHTPTFSTFYSAQFSIDQTETQDDRLISGQVGFNKKIYESLDISAWLQARDRTFDTGSEQSIGGFLDARYRKRTPIGGYTSLLLVGRQYEQEESTGGIRRVLDEPVTLVGISPARLSEPNVQIGSIVVTDITNTITYVEGIDYLLDRFGAFIEIRRIAGGDIDPGETVLVDYTVQFAEDATFTTDTIRWLHRIDLDDLPLAFYFEYSLLEETLISGTDPGNLEREQGMLFGAEVDLDHLVFTAEHEIREMRLTPSWAANRFRVRYHRLLRPDVDLTIGGEYEMLRYQDAEAFGLPPGQDYLETYGAFARLATRVNRNILLRIEGNYLQTMGREEDTLAQIGAGLDWNLRDSQISIEAFHSVYEQDQTEGVSDYITFSFRRYF